KARHGTRSANATPAGWPLNSIATDDAGEMTATSRNRNRFSMASPGGGIDTRHGLDEDRQSKRARRVAGPPRVRGSRQPAPCEGGGSTLDRPGRARAGRDIRHGLASPDASNQARVAAALGVVKMEIANERVG